MQEVTGHMPRMMRYVKDALIKEEQKHPAATPEARIRAAIEWVENDTMREGKDELDRTFSHLSKEKQNAFVDYLGHILLPAWYHGLPTARDGKLYDKGFIFHDDSKHVLRVVNGPARRALLNLFVEQTRAAETNMVKVYVLFYMYLIAKYCSYQ